MKKRQFPTLIIDSLIEEKQVDKTERSIISYISTKAVDRDNDIVLPEGIDLTNYRKNPIVLFNHDWKLPAIGTSPWQKSDAKGMLAKTIFGSTPFADDIYTLHLENILKAWSIGIILRKWNTDENNGITTITESELLEYSSVNLPSNPEALDEAKHIVKSIEAKQLIEYKNIDIQIQQQLINLEKQLKELQNAVNELKETSVLNDIEQLENKIAYLEKRIETIIIQNLKYNLQPGEILAGIDVKSIVGRNITRAKQQQQKNN